MSQEVLFATEGKKQDEKTGNYYREYLCFKHAVRHAINTEDVYTEVRESETLTDKEYCHDCLKGL